jgi:serine/threonine kinase 16
MLLNPFIKKSKLIEIQGIKYVIDEQIGEGAFGYVYRVKEYSSALNSHSVSYAIKKMICQSEDQIQEAQLEIRVLSQINHGNVLSIINSCIVTAKSSENIEVYLLLPLYQVSLQQLIDDGLGYPECSIANRRDVQKIIFGCVSGLYAIHAAGYRHGDIKPANILLDSDRNPVITDFGSAVQLRVEVTNRQQALAIQDAASSKTTASFRSPELFDTPSHCVIDGKSDVWGMGCTYFATLFSRTPFEAPIEGLSVLAVLSGNFAFPLTSTWPPEYHTMISACLRVDAEQRLSCDDLKILAGILPDPVDYLTLLAPLSPHTNPSPSHKDNKSESFGQSLIKKLTSIEILPETPKRPAAAPSPIATVAPVTNGFETAAFPSFADFEHFPEPSSSAPPVSAAPATPSSLPPSNALVEPSPSTTNNDSFHANGFKDLSSQGAAVTQDGNGVQGCGEEEEEDDEEWNFQSCEASLLTSDEPLPDPSPALPQEPIAEEFPEIAHQDSDDFEFGDFQDAEKNSVPSELQVELHTSETVIRAGAGADPREAGLGRDDSVDSVNSKFASIELSGPVFMMRTRRSLLLKQRVKKKVTLSSTLLLLTLLSHSSGCSCVGM